MLMVVLTALIPLIPSSGLGPQVFAPGVISSPAHDSAPAFAPDNRNVVFGRSSPAASFILMAHRAPVGWSEPVIAPFSGQWLDMEPAMSPDGTYLIFASNRPAIPGGAPVDGEKGESERGKGSNLWRVDRTPSGWGQPVRLPDSINVSGSTYAPSVAGDGTLYFMRPNPTTHRFQLYEAPRSTEGYGPATPLSFSDGSDTDVDPAIARDKSFLVFGSGRHQKKDIDLFIAFRTESGWSQPLYLGDQINGPSSDAEPRLSPDNHTLYFSSDRLAPVTAPIAPGRAAEVLREMTSWNNGLYNIWSVSLMPILRQVADTQPNSGRRGPQSE
jgi:Tol biopolymer transport system component